jgi:hypothetical protein
MNNHKMILIGKEFQSDPTGYLIKLPDHIDVILSMKSRDWSLLKFTFNPETKVLKILHPLGIKEKLEITYLSKQIDRDEKINSVLNG